MQAQAPAAGAKLQVGRQGIAHALGLTRHEYPSAYLINDSAAWSHSRGNLQMRVCVPVTVTPAGRANPKSPSYCSKLN
jgi:hypothetical protein